MKETRTTRTPVFERLGLAYLLRLERFAPHFPGEDAIHILNARERHALIRVERQAVFWAALIGMLTALVCAFSWDTTVYFLGETTQKGMFNNWCHWLLVAMISVIATASEIVLIYLNAMIAVHRLSRGAGVELFDQARRPKEVAAALVKAALDLPMGGHEDVFVRPGHELSKWQILLVSVIYKLKVTVTYYFFKLTFQRVFGRILVRWAIDLVAVPIYAFWNAVTTRWVLRQARICVMGPSAVVAFLDEVYLKHPNSSSDFRTAILLAAGSTIARNPELHPNIRFLTIELLRRYGTLPASSQICSSRFLELLQRLDLEERLTVLAVFVFSTLVDGRLFKAEVKLVGQAYKLCERQFDRSQLRLVTKRFVDGSQVSLASVHGLMT